MLPPRRLHGSKRRAVCGYTHCRHAAMGASGAAVTGTGGVLVACAVVAGRDFAVATSVRRRHHMLAMIAMIDVVLRVRRCSRRRPCRLRQHGRRYQRKSDYQSKKRSEHRAKITGWA